MLWVVHRAAVRTKFMSDIVLASASPRRQQLLAYLDVPFVVDPSTVDEPSHSAPTPAELAGTLARAKAADVAMRHMDAVVIGADTLVDLDGQVLNKPVDQSDAIRMLTLLAGRTHCVHTGIAVWKGDTCLSEVVTARVTLRAASLPQIEAYVATGEPLDKAGAYAAQGQGAALIERVEGSYLCVVGLPLLALRTLLQAIGVESAASPSLLERLERGEAPDR